MSDKTSVKPKGQAAMPMWEMLQAIFPQVQCERRFPWLALPGPDDASDVEAEVRAALISHCRTTQPTQSHLKKRECTPELLTSKLTSPGRPMLEFDFFVPGISLAIEFDERQHFTAERAVSLECYGGRLHTGFDTSLWIEKCRTIRAVDPDPIWRDWQRAYRDAVRDIRADANGVKLVRYAYDAPPTIEMLRTLAD